MTSSSIDFRGSYSTLKDMIEFRSTLGQSQINPDPWRTRRDCFDACYMKYESCFCKKNTAILFCDNIQIDE